MLAMHSLGQDAANRLYNDITQHRGVETKHVGCYGRLSALFSKVDSLKKLVGDEAFADYFKDTSRVIKYYSFLAQLVRDDNKALELLTSSIADTTRIDYEFAGQNRGVVPFNSLLTMEYLQFIRAKYYYGGRLSFHNHFYPHPKSKRTWKLKKAAIDKLMAQHEVDQSIINNYYTK
ncbi:MAG TPA: hypothetical protein VD996_09870 [Chitinophagaceae bacterium]|nr:hypothetical protein [Chitinophagaceae bacterium]